MSPEYPFPSPQAEKLRKEYDVDIRVLGIADSAEMVLSNGGPLDLSGGVQALVKAKVGGCGGWVGAWWCMGGWLSNGGPLDLSGGVQALLKAKMGGHVQVCFAHQAHLS